MRKDHRPYWLKRGLDRVNQYYVDRICRPQFDHSGIGLSVMNPRHVQISGPNIRVGDHVHIMALPDKPVRLAVFEGLGRISIGDYCLINPGVRMTSATSIDIGHSCMLAMNCYLGDADWHDLQHRIYAPGNSAAIVLKDNVWIGDGALVVKGVTIGHNSIVGAYSVVTHDVPDNVIVAGNPARVVRALDTGHRTTRQQLFTGESSYADFADEYSRRLMQGNTLVHWLRSLWRPSSTD
ncbi:MAG: acetyltransferase-like isoleucine patch superfamily enzyme [Urechidicola sp.]